MTRNRSSGFVETILLLVFFWALTVVGILPVTPQLKSLVFSSTASHLFTPSPTSVPDPLRFDHAIGIQITDSSHVEVQLDGEQTSIPLIGLENDATPSADMKHTLDDITKKIRGKTLYMIYSDTTHQINGVYPRYIFLDDGSSLNSYLIAQGMAHASSNVHPYLADFTMAEQHAREEKKGIWADTPETTVTLTLTPRSIAVVPTLLPSPTPTRLPTAKLTTFIPSITHVPPTPTKMPPINLYPYLTSTSSAVAQQTSLNSQRIFDMINDYRTSKNLKPFQKDEQLCALAGSRAPELYNEIFVTGKVHEGFYSRNVPYWITENMASYPTEQQIVNWWLTSPIHRSAIEGNYKYSCGACSGTSCTQLFTSYTTK